MGGANGHDSGAGGWAPPYMHANPNRHERRKAAAIERRAGSVADYQAGLASCIRTVAAAEPDKQLAVYENMAREAGTYVRDGGLEKADAADRMSEAAESIGLVAAHGADVVQAALAKGLQAGIEFKNGGAIEINLSTPAEKKTGRDLVILDACSIPPRKVDWLWQHRIALGKQTLIGGEPGLSKSQVLCSLAAVVSTGGNWPADEGRAPIGNVIMFSAEDDPEDTLIPRLLAAGADLRRVKIIPAVRETDGSGNSVFNLQTDLAALERAIETVGDVKLVTFDPISSYLGERIDTHKNAETRRVLEPLSGIAARHRVAVVSVTHSPKGQSGKAVHHFVGSVAFSAVVRAAFLVMRDPDAPDRRLFLCAKNNLGPDSGGLAYRIGAAFVGDERDIPAPFILWENEPVTMTANEALAADGDTAERSTKAEAGEFLKELLADGPVPQKDVKEQADAAGYSWPTIKRAKKTAGVQAYPEHAAGKRGAGRWLWRIKGLNPVSADSGEPLNKIEQTEQLDQLNTAENGLRGSEGKVSPLIGIEPLNATGGTA